MMIGHARSNRRVLAVAIFLSMTVVIGLPVQATAAEPGFADHVGRLARRVAEEHGLATGDALLPRIDPAATADLNGMWMLPGTDAVLAEEPATGFSLQDSGLEPWEPSPKKFWVAFGEAMITQLVPWVNNSFIRKNEEGGRGEPWSRDIGWKSWANNYARSFEWDDNQFINNQFSHPYHGGLYYSAARTNGFDYYESMAFAFLNSWLWEYHGEAFRPAINDWIKTSLGGTAIGEMTYRLSEKVTDNAASGFGRTMGEIGGFLVSPVRGFDRGVKGQWGRQWDNSPDRLIPVRSYFEVGMFGAKEAANNLSAAEETPVTTFGETEFEPFVPAEKVRLSTARFNLRYGDPFVKHDKPFDAFEISVQAAFGSDVAALNRITISGWLHFNEYDWAEGNRHAFVVRQRYEYFNNEVLQFGTQAFGFGLNSLFRADKKIKVRTMIEGQALALAAIDSPYAEQVGRTYDYGPGLGLQMQARVQKDGLDYVELNLGSMLIHTINGGGEGDHNVTYGSLRVTIPIVGRFGVGGEYGYVRRDGFFTDYPDFKRDFDYARLFVSWVTK
jgi:hypothetical protein